jgi:hypothetical protein
MNTLLTFLALACGPTTMIGFNGPLNEVDKASLAQAKVRCGELYKESPCVKLFQKMGEREYRVMCGAAEK